jgi:hypothetical protein
VSSCGLGIFGPGERHREDSDASMKQLSSPGAAPFELDCEEVFRCRGNHLVRKRDRLCLFLSKSKLPFLLLVELFKISLDGDVVADEANDWRGGTLDEIRARDDGMDVDILGAFRGAVLLLSAA